jgi:hypothetical protein
LSAMDSMLLIHLHLPLLPMLKDPVGLQYHLYSPILREEEIELPTTPLSKG